MKKDFSGVWTALITPFKKQKVDFKSLESLIQFQEGKGLSGFVINGTTAESPCLEEEEVRDIFHCVRSQFKGPLILGVGSNSTAKTQKMAVMAQELGADGILVVVPYYNKPPEKGLIQHFLAVADATELPLILYNVPSRTITSLSVEAVIQLSQHPNIMGIKEAQGNMEYSKELIQKKEKEFQVLSGDDLSCFEQNLLGGCGVISVVSHLIAEKFVSFEKLSRKGQKDFQDEFKTYQRLIEQLFSVPNPIPVKKALQLMGVIESAELRLPLVELEQEQTQRLQKTLEELSLV